MHTPFIITFN